jgi:inorganic phosphate transporter, PiT family
MGSAPAKIKPVTKQSQSVVTSADHVCGTYPSLAVLVREISKQVDTYGSVAKLPGEVVANTRNDMYLASEAVRFVLKDKENELSKEEAAKLVDYKKSLDEATRFIPLWVKVAVAIALGLGTMIGW